MTCTFKAPPGSQPLASDLVSRPFYKVQSPCSPSKLDPFGDLSKSIWLTGFTPPPQGILPDHNLCLGPDGTRGLRGAFAPGEPPATLLPWALMARPVQHNHVRGADCRGC